MTLKFTREGGAVESDESLLEASISYRGGHWIEAIHRKPRAPFLVFHLAKVNKRRGTEWKSGSSLP